MDSQKSITPAFTHSSSDMTFFIIRIAFWWKTIIINLQMPSSSSLVWTTLFHAHSRMYRRFSAEPGCSVDEVGLSEDIWPRYMVRVCAREPKSGDYVHVSEIGWAVLQTGWPLTLCSPLLDTASDQPHTAGFHRCGQNGIQLLFLEANIKLHTIVKTSE